MGVHNDLQMNIVNIKISNTMLMDRFQVCYSSICFRCSYLCQEMPGVPATRADNMNRNENFTTRALTEAKIYTVSLYTSQPPKMHEITLV